MYSMVMRALRWENLFSHRKKHIQFVCEGILVQIALKFDIEKKNILFL